MIIKLTTDFIANQLQCPEGQRRIEYVDKGGTGLYVEVRSTSQGLGTFYLRWKNANGKTCHQKIGRTTEITLDDARQRAKMLKAQITLGADPQAERNSKNAVVTFDSLLPGSLHAARQGPQPWMEEEITDVRFAYWRKHLAKNAWIRSSDMKSAHGISHCAKMGYLPRIPIVFWPYFATL